MQVLGIDDEVGGPLWVHIETVAERPTCPHCGHPATLKDRDMVELIDLPAFGRQTRLVWRKHRWVCRQASCPVGSWTAQEPTIAAPRLAMTDRAGRWVTEQVCRRHVRQQTASVMARCPFSAQGHGRRRRSGQPDRSRASTKATRGRSCSTASSIASLKRSASGQRQDATGHGRLWLTASNHSSTARS
ncbi:MAG: transposase family protein [Ilumatobacteraceae bacterium]